MRRLLAVAALILAVAGCAPKRPATLDYAPDWVSPTMPCSMAGSVVEATMRSFHDGAPPPEKYSECSAFFTATMRFAAPENGCATQQEIEALTDRYLGEPGPAFGEWLKPCAKTIGDANAYAAELQDYVTKENAGGLTGNKAMMLLLGAALASQ